MNTLVAFPCLLSNIYDAEVPLLRGIRHPTAKTGFESGGPEVSPSGLELVDLLAAAVEKVRSDLMLSDLCVEKGFVATMLNTQAFGSEDLYNFLNEIRKKKMLRLFGIAEEDDGEIFVSKHALKTPT